ncbi:PAS domain S-box protein [Planctomicrobium piriforme]|uniref:histidine kinase n=1 Tax=Planctomicrobium piriforme TaxID=1576369 RepID=A0A1I3RU30_9PLAN|nr:PAS domain S-box protein [Planctomicrobium piriforme]SFJ50063.1 PAS domain S-box-containing protein [Planctomicrobium piriforme]
MRSFLRRLFSRKLEPPRIGRASGQADIPFTQLVAAVRDYAILLLDPEGHVRSWNAGAEQIKGYRADEIIGQHFKKFYPQEAQAFGWPTHELSVAASTGRFEDEGWRIRKDGSRFWANVVITAVRDPERGGLIGYLKITRDLTDRRLAEDKLRMSEERFRLLVEGVQDYAIFMLDPDGRVATWNTGAQRIKGYSAEEIIGEHFSRFYPAEALQRGWPETELRQAAADGRFEDEGWRIRKDGSPFWANVVITALRDQTGILRGFAKVTRDLSERRRAEDQARQLLQEEASRKAAEASFQEAQSARDEERRHRSQLQVTLSSIGDAVIVTDCAGRVTFLNPVATELTGWTPETAAGSPLDDVFQIVNEETRRPVESPVTKVLREGVVVGLANHTVLIARNGREVPIDDSGAPIRGQNGEIAGVVLVFRDVTEARRAVETRLHLAAIVESSDDAIIGQDLQGTILSWNSGAQRLYGYRAEDIIGRPLTALAPPDHADEMPQMLQQIMQGEHIEHFETVRMRVDGTRVDVSLTVSPIRNASGNVIGASKIARDISERKREDRRKNEFLAILAHELRNPLAALRSGLDVLQLPGSDAAETTEILTIMSGQMDHLVRMVDDLLDISRIARGTLELRKSRVSLQQIVKSAVEMCAPGVAAREQKLHVRLPDEDIPLFADNTRLAQAISNLVTNASKYSGRGDPISVTVEKSGDTACIRVRDVGIGIPPPQLSGIFEMFAQLKQTSATTQNGMGVGLAIVKRLVELHGGVVEAHSAGPGRGSEFLIRLPASTPLGGESAGNE